MAQTRARWNIVWGRKIYILNGTEIETLMQAEQVNPDMMIGLVYVLGNGGDGCPNEYGEYTGRDNYGHYLFRSEDEPNPYCFRLVATTGDRCDNGKSMNKIVMIPACLIDDPVRIKARFA